MCLRKGPVELMNDQVGRGKSFSHHHTNDGPENRAGYEIRKPMDGHRNTNSHIRRVGDCQKPEPSLLRKEPPYGNGHSEGDSRVRGRPAPKDPAPQHTEFEDMSQVSAEAVRGMGATGKGLVTGGNNPADDLGLPYGPAGQPGWSALCGGSHQEQEQRERNWQKSADGHSRPYKGPKDRRARSGEVAPVETRHDQNEGEQNRNNMPEERSAFEASDEVAR